MKQNLNSQLLTRIIVLSFILGNCLLLLKPVQASPTSKFYVTVFEDLSDINLGDGVCDAKPDVGEQCTLRAAVEEANVASNADDIVLWPGIYFIESAQGSLKINSNVSIDGRGSIVDGQNSVQVLQVIGSNNIMVGFTNLTVRHGVAVSGGGLYVGNQQALVVLNQVTMQQNTALNGGAIYNNGLLSMVNSTIYQNHANGGFNYGYGGGIYNNKTLAMANTTISGNRANSYGGGLFAWSNADLNNITITDNTADATANGVGDGGGVFIQAGIDFKLRNSIIADNKDNTVDANQQYPDCFGLVQSAGHNLLGVVEGCGGIGHGVNSDFAGTLAQPFPALLEPLAPNGGMTWTHALKKTSPADTLGDAATCEAQDQRLGERPSGSCSAGAYQILASFEVNSANDTADAADDGLCKDADGNCTLRAAVEEANRHPDFNEIHITVGSGPYYLSGTPLEIGSPMAIRGLGVEIFNDSNVAVDIYNADGVLLEGLQLKPMRPGSALATSNSIVTFAESTISGFNVLGNNGAMRSSVSAMTILDSAIYDNAVEGRGGGIHLIRGLLLLQNSTVSGNTATESGGGVSNFKGHIEIHNTTITNNTADADNNGSGAGGGIVNNSGLIFLNNSVVAANHDLSGTAVDCSGTLVSWEYNLVGVADGCTGISDGLNHDQAGTAAAPFDPQLEPLANNGGATPTHGLKPNSPLRDAGNPYTLTSRSCAAYDQRGAMRAFSICDIGALEDVPALVVNSTADTHDVNLGDHICEDSQGKCTLRAAVDEANAHPDLTIINLSSTSGAHKITLEGSESANASGDFNLLSNMLIQGLGSAPAPIDGQQNGRVFAIAPDLYVHLDNLSMTGGLENNDGGAIVNAFGNLTVSNSQILDNEAGDEGGGIFNYGYLTVQQSTVANNRAGLGGGVFSGGSAIFSQSDVTDNMAQVVNVNYGGGGIFSTRALRLFETTVAGNQVTGFGKGGGIFHMGAGLHLEKSTVSGNEAADGGGIYGYQSEALIRNSTISGNQSRFDGGGLYFINQSAVDLRNATITNNTADSDGDNTGDGGGILNGADNVVTLLNTIIAGNHDSSLGNGIVSQDCVGAALISKGYNLTGCGALGGINDRNTAEPRLGPLQDNGGYTLTHAPLADSLAIDGGSAVSANLLDACPYDDQSGNNRPLDGNNDGQETCDIGAYEYTYQEPTEPTEPTEPGEPSIYTLFLPLIMH